MSYITPYVEGCMNKHGKDGVAHLAHEHDEVDKMFNEYKTADPATKKSLVDKITTLLCQHSSIEETVFYPMINKRMNDQMLVDRFLLDHQAVKETLYWLLNNEREKNEQLYDATVEKLAMNVQEHVKHEELLFKRLKSQLNQQELEMLCRDLCIAEEFAPTRPHPWAPAQGLSAKIAQPLTGILEKGAAGIGKMFEQLKTVGAGKQGTTEQEAAQPTTTPASSAGPSSSSSSSYSQARHT